MAPDHEERLRRARLSLEGLSVGDAFGEQFFLPPETARSLIERREVPETPWAYTDDSAMALGIVEVLGRFGRIDHEELARVFARRYQEEPWRGYGMAAQHILRRVGAGASWRVEARQVFGGEGSWGNGGGMRSAPIGAYFADDRDRAAREAAASAEVTHAHPEGQAGAIAVAVGAAVAACERNAPPSTFLATIWEYVPDGQTREGIARAIELPPETALGQAVSVLGNGSRVSAPDTVPFALWCAARSLQSFEDALWLTVSGLGDRDTTCAMVGGIVVLSAGVRSIPGEWLAAREPLPPVADVAD